MSNWRESIRDMLIDSYKPRIQEGCCCAICGNDKLPLSFHVIKYAQDENDQLPDGFVPMSASGGTIRGCFPICINCSKPCAICNMAIVTKPVDNYFRELKEKMQGRDVAVLYGNGVCRHPLIIRVFFKLFYKGK